MQISVCQFAPGRDVRANLDCIADLARQVAASGAELAVFPEAAMFQCMSPADEVGAVAQHLDGPFVQALTEVACSTGVVLVVGMYERRAGGKPYNSVVAVGPDGLRAHHRKFLVYDAFGFRESDLVEVAAPRTDLFTVGDLSIGLITCYEVRFPECARSLVDAGADLLLVCSAWPIGQGKEDHFTTMVYARALENTVYVAASGDCSPTMVGRSHIMDPLGYQLAGLGNEQGHATAEIDSAGSPAPGRRCPSSSSAAVNSAQPSRPPTPTMSAALPRRFHHDRTARPPHFRPGRARCRCPRWRAFARRLLQEPHRRRWRWCQRQCRRQQ